MPGAEAKFSTFVFVVVLSGLQCQLSLFTFNIEFPLVLNP